MSELTEFWQDFGLEQVSVPDVRVEGELLEDAEHYRVYSFSFPSPISSPYPANNTVYGQLVIGKDLPEDAPAAVLLHGLTAGSHYYDILETKTLLSAGIHSIILEMPYHFARTPEGTEPGDLMFSADLGQTKHAIGQAVAEAAVALKWACYRGHRSAGLLGLSGGGLVACLAAAQADADFLIAIAPAVDWAALMWDGQVSQDVAHNLRGRYSSLEDLKRELRPLDPAEFQPRVPKERILLIEGLYDRVVLPQQVERLWQAWGKPPIARLPRSHFTLLTSAQLYKELKAFGERLTSSS